jgi:ureidoglycolate hydrolase
MMIKARPLDAAAFAPFGQVPGAAKPFATA